MDWTKKIAWFFVGLLIAGVLSALIGALYTNYLRPFLWEIRMRFILRRAHKEVHRMMRGEIIPDRETRFTPQAGGGMTIQTYKNGVVVKEEVFTAWEWQQQIKVADEMFGGRSK